MRLRRAAAAAIAVVVVTLIVWISNELRGVLAPPSAPEVAVGPLPDAPLARDASSGEGEGPHPAAVATGVSGGGSGGSISSSAAAPGSDNDIDDTAVAAAGVRSADETRLLLTAQGTPACAVELFEQNFAALERANATTLAEERRASRMSLAGTGVDQAYVVHYTPLRARRGLMQELLEGHGVRAQWVLGFDKEALTPAAVACVQHWQPAAFEAAFPAKAHRHRVVPAPRLKLAQISVVVKHHSALYDVVRRRIPMALILEDDALLRNGFKRRLAEVVRESQSDAVGGWDIMMVGGCMRMHAFRRKFSATRLTAHLFAKREARCAHAFLVTQRGAQAILASIPLTLPIDFQLSAAIVERELRCLWVEPFLSKQGNFGGCVTNELGARVKCVSIEKYDRNFDLRFINSTQMEAFSWERIPPPGQK